MLTVTVSQLNRYIKAVLEEDRKLRDVYVKGEISGFVRHGKSGHCYFRLADEDGTIRAVIFRQNAELLEFEPEDGMAVLARASVGVFEREGAYQIYVTEIVPDGAGAIAVALAQKKARLEAQGVFDAKNKKSLPKYPARVGVITSKSGAALHDIRTVLGRRWPSCAMVLAAAVVQGREAPASLRVALESLDRVGCDVIILSRGGGSAEDLGAFNDEELVLTLFRCKTPVISAVGHETDYTLCDFAADARAPTPSAAAELAVPDREELCRMVDMYRARLSQMAAAFMSEKQGTMVRCSALSQKAQALLRNREAALARVKEHPALKSPQNALIKSKQALDIYAKSLYNNKRIFIQGFTRQLNAKASLLDSLSPLRILDRGYCLARKGQEISTAGALAAGDEVELLFADGAADARILNVERRRKDERLETGKL